MNPALRVLRLALLGLVSLLLIAAAYGFLRTLPEADASWRGLP